MGLSDKIGQPFFKIKPNTRLFSSFFKKSPLLFSPPLHMLDMNIIIWYLFNAFSISGFKGKNYTSVEELWGLLKKK